MEFTCLQKELKKHLAVISRVVPTRPTHPILAYFLLEIDAVSATLRITGFDLSVGIRSEIKLIEAQGSKTIALPAKLLNEIVGKISDEIIKFTDVNPNNKYFTDNKNNEAIYIVTSSGNFELIGADPEQYPAFPVSSTEPIMIPVSVFKDGLKGTLFNACTEPTKQILTGVHLVQSRDSLEFAATDSHRLSVVTVESSCNAEWSLTVPGKALSEIEKILSVSDSEFLLFSSDSNILTFDCGAFRVTSRALEGNFPNYRQLLPTSFKGESIVNRKDFINQLSLINVFGAQENQRIKMVIDFAKPEIELSSNSQPIGMAICSIPSENIGECEITLNAKYLLDGLKQMESDDIKIEFNSNISPVIIMPMSGVKMTYLVMPLQAS